MQVTVESSPTRSPWTVFAVTSLAVFAVLLDALIVIVAFPTITRAFAGAPVTDVSWVVNAYTIVYAALLVPAGGLADRFGRKRLFLAGVGVFTAFSVLSGFAPSLDLLIAFRVLQAVGGAFLSSTGLALTLAAFPRERRVLAVTLVGAVGALAVAIGPTIGAAIVQYWDWRGIFFVNLPVGLLAGIAGARVLRESREESRARRPDPAGIALLVAGAALGTYGIIESGPLGWTDPSAFAPVLAGLGLLGLLALEVRRSRSPVVDPGLFRDRNFFVANVGLFVFSIGFAALFFSTVYFLTLVWHYSLLTTGLVMIPPALVVAALAPLAGRLSVRFGHRSVAVPGGLLFAAGQAVLWSRVSPTPDYLGLWFPTSLLTGVGIAFVLPVLTSAFAQNLPSGEYAVGSGVGVAFRQFGTVVGAALAISYLADPSRTLAPFDHLWALSVLTGIGASLLALGLVRATSSPAPQGRPEEVGPAVGRPAG